MALQGASDKRDDTYVAGAAAGAAGSRRQENKTGSGGSFGSGSGSGIRRAPKMEEIFGSSVKESASSQYNALLSDRPFESENVAGFDILASGSGVQPLSQNSLEKREKLREDTKKKIDKETLRYTGIERQNELDAGGVGERATAKPLTWDEYQRLGTYKKAAVDFNTMMAQAAEKDRKLQGSYKPTPEERAAYDQRLEKIFGASWRGSATTYAPELVATLDQMGYRDQNADLDQLLNLTSGITDADLDYVNKDNVAEGVLNPVERDWSGGALKPTGRRYAEAKPYGVMPGLPLEAEGRIELANQLAAQTVNWQEERAQETVKRGEVLMRDFNVQMKRDVNRDVELLGGKANVVKDIDPGWSPVSEEFLKTGQPKDLNDWLISRFDALANPLNTGDPKEGLRIIRDELASEGLDMSVFTNYAQARLAKSKELELPLGFAKDPQGNKVEYHSPEEYMKLLGLDKKGLS